MSYSLRNNSITAFPRIISRFDAHNGSLRSYYLTPTLKSVIYRKWPINFERYLNEIELQTNKTVIKNVDERMCMYQQSRREHLYDMISPTTCILVYLCVNKIFTIFTITKLYFVLKSWTFGNRLYIYLIFAKVCLVCHTFFSSHNYCPYILGFDVFRIYFLFTSSREQMVFHGLNCAIRV